MGVTLSNDYMKRIILIMLLGCGVAGAEEETPAMAGIRAAQQAEAALRAADAEMARTHLLQQIEANQRKQIAADKEAAAKQLRVTEDIQFKLDTQKTERPKDYIVLSLD